MQVSYSNDWVYLRSSGLGYHVMGPWYGNAAHTQMFPNFPANTNVLFRIPRAPVVAATKTLTGAGAIGYFVDGVALFDGRDTFSYVNSTGTDGSPAGTARGDGIWNRDAYVNEGVTFDGAFAHQAGSNYHYHANAPALRHLLGDNVDYNSTTKGYTEKVASVTRHSPILGWIADGYPVYGPYGYSSPMDATSTVRRMNPGFVKRDGSNQTTNLIATGRTTLPQWAARAQGRTATLTATQQGPAVNPAYVLGHYIEDYDYLGDLGKTQGVDFDLDIYNGRFCVTPEFPQGTYAYFMTIEADGTPKFPYNVGRWYYGDPVGRTVARITEPVTEYVRGGQAAAINVTAVSRLTGVAVSWTSVEGGTYSIATSTDGATFTPLVSGLTSAGLATTHSTTSKAAYYRVTLAALAAYDTRGTGGLSGLNETGTARYAVQTVGSTGTAKLVNVATRVQVGGVAGTPISGFVLGGIGSKKMVTRAVGPTLTTFNVSGALTDPSLTIVASGSTIASNDNWTPADSAAFAAVGAFGLNTGSRDAAIVTTLNAGVYSAVVGSGGSSGVTLLEVYDADPAASSARLVNASTRAYVGSGEQGLIPGFVIMGDGAIKLLLRAVGPTLADFGVTGELVNPQINVYSGATIIASNDNWSSAANATAMAEAAVSAGAFTLAPGSRDAAMILELRAGAYTVAVSGVNGSTGTALLEFYVLP